jgi:methylenetetrahydrofolate dehydrogenase (NADP+) / methenyltetrahydrofolate cyclohydrolase
MQTPPFFARAARLGFTLPEIPTEVLARTVAGTSTRLLDGRFVADELVAQCAALGRRRVPRLVVVLAGEDPASAVYVGNKEKMFAKAGFASETLRLSSAEATQERSRPQCACGRGRHSRSIAASCGHRIARYPFGH